MTIHDELPRMTETLYVFSLEVSMADPTSKRGEPRKVYVTMPIVGPSDEPLVVSLAARKKLAAQFFMTVDSVIARSYTMLYGHGSVPGSGPSDGKTFNVHAVVMGQ